MENNKMDTLKNSYENFLMGVLVSVCALLICAIVGIGVYGMMLAFMASILLGISCMFIPVLPMIIGSYGLFTGKNLAIIIVEFIKHLAK